MLEEDQQNVGDPILNKTSNNSSTVSKPNEIEAWTAIKKKGRPTKAEAAKRAQLLALGNKPTVRASQHET